MRDLAILQILIPLALCAWLALGRPSRWADFLSRAAAAWLVMAGIALAGIWLAAPLIVVPFLGCLLVVATAVGTSRMRRRNASEGKSAWRWVGRLVTVGAAAFGLWLLVPAIVGRARPAAAIELAFPFREGRFLVANGGTTERVNGHLMTLRPQFRKWRGESYAVDLIKVDSLGFRTRERRLLNVPPDPAAYLTFGEKVYSPCRGRVEASEQGRPDMRVPIRDREHLEGNFVLLRCGRVMILLAHFRKGDVRVTPGQMVATGQLLGTVGNSGNSDEPHLHIHAQAQGPATEPLAGDPLFVTYDGKFLVRNMVVRPSLERDRDR